MSIYKTTFTFTSTPYASPVIMEFPVGDDIMARLETASPSVARLYFVREQAEVAIPSDVEVFDETNKLQVYPFLAYKQHYLLSWSDDYSIYRDDTLLVSLTQKRSWSVYGDSTLPVYLMET